MTKSSSAASAAGGSSLDSLFRSILQRVELPRNDDFSFDEIQKWEPGVFDMLASLGVLREGDRSTWIFLEECERQEAVEPYFCVNPVTGKLRGVYNCGHQDCVGLHLIDPERMRTWWLDWDGLAATVARAAKAQGPTIVDVTGRITLLGTITRGEVTRELYLARGWTWSDRESAYVLARRLVNSTNATVLFLNHLPELPRRPRSWKTVLALSEVGLIRKGKLTLPLHRLFEDQSLTPPTAIEGLSERHIRVLRALARTPGQTVLIPDLEFRAESSKRTLRKLIDRLVAAGLVARPPGTKRAGVMITEQGLAQLKNLEPADSRRHRLQ